MIRFVRKLPIGIAALCAALLFQAPALAGPGDAGHGHDMSHAHDNHHDFMYGEPGRADEVSRTISVEAGDIQFDRKLIEVRSGSTVRFIVRNTGKLPHEFVIADSAEQKEHAEMMKRMPGMKHNDPNAVSIPPGETRELIWKFAGKQDLQFACHVPGHYEAGMVGVIRVK